MQVAVAEISRSSAIRVIDPDILEVLHLFCLSTDRMDRFGRVEHKMMMPTSAVVQTATYDDLDRLAGPLRPV